MINWGKYLGKKISTQFLSAKKIASVPRKIEEKLVKSERDLVGPPNPISNIRPITFHVPKNETRTQKELRLTRQKVQNWHEDFWTKHNTSFIKERKEFEDAYAVKGASLGADEMSIFYKDFLDKYWHRHLAYNKEWYKLNYTLLKLSLQAEIERYVLKILNR